MMYSNKKNKMNDLNLYQKSIIRPLVEARMYKYSVPCTILLQLHYACKENCFLSKRWVCLLFFWGPNPRI